MYNFGSCTPLELGVELGVYMTQGVLLASTKYPNPTQPDCYGVGWVGLVLRIIIDWVGLGWVGDFSTQ